MSSWSRHVYLVTASPLGGLRMNAKVVLDGLVLGESPRWHDGRLWVADWAAHELITLDADGRTLYIVTAQWPSDFRTPTGQVLAVQVTVPGARTAAAR
jgi:sugar lactone lactonase YvrE